MERGIKTPERQSQVELELSRLSSEVDYLGEVTSDLGKRLSKVLSNAPPAEAREQGPNASVVLANDISLVTGRIQIIKDQIVDITSRLEL